MTSRSESGTLAEPRRTTAADVALALGDDALVASQRLIEWIARAPSIEEDVALANIALDLLGQARTLLAYAGSLQDPPRTEDDLAYLRDAGAFRNVALLERENGDFAVTMVRQLLLSAYQYELYGALRDGPDPTLAAIAAKAVPEVRYHRDHARLWVVRLGDGTPESRRRTEAALASEWPWFAGLFAPVTTADPIDLAALEAPARAWLGAVLTDATLAVPGPVTDPDPAVIDGRRGRHTPALTELLTELQLVAREHPGASW